MAVDYTVDIGTLIQIGILIFGGVAAFMRLTGEITNLRKDVDKLSGIGVNLATHEIRIAHLETELRFMKGNNDRAA